MTLKATTLTVEEQDHLLSWVSNGYKVMSGRAAIILKHTEGACVDEISAELGTCTRTVRKWINLFNEKRLYGLQIVIPRKVPYKRTGRKVGGFKNPHRSQKGEGVRRKLLAALDTLDNASVPLNTYEFVDLMRGRGYRFTNAQAAGAYLNTYFWRVGTVLVQTLSGASYIGLWRGRVNSGSRSSDMSILDSICRSCEFARPKPLYCIECGFVLTCPGARIPNTTLSNRYCPHIEYDPDVCSIEVKVCEQWKEVR